MEPWHSRSTFVFALAAAAIGLGNVWRFAYLLGENGGAPFMLAYIAALLLIATPIMVAEVVVGTLGRSAPWGSVAEVARNAGRRRAWALLVIPMLLTALVMLVASILIAAWSLAFAFHHQLGSFAAISLPGTQQFFDRLLANPLRSLMWVALAMLPLLAAALAGVRRGVAPLMWLCISLLLVLFAVLIDFAIAHGDLEAAGQFLFARQGLDFTAESLMQAFALALYTLGVGVAVGLTFGSYAPERLPLCRSVLAVALFDIVLAVAVSVAIYPLLFASNLAPAQGMGLLFIALPYAFGNLSLGDFYGTLFFFAVYVVSLASAVALLESLILTLQQLRLTRVRSALLAAGGSWVLAAVALYSLEPGSLHRALFEEAETLASEVLLPAGVVLFALFAGWLIPRGVLREALNREPDILFSLWYFLLRFLVPPAVIVIALWVHYTAG